MSMKVTYESTLYDEYPKIARPVEDEVLSIVRSTITKVNANARLHYSKLDSNDTYNATYTAAEIKVIIRRDMIRAVAVALLQCMAFA
jgi:hypothetical protein